MGLALVWQRWRGVSLPFGDPVSGVVFGLGAAVLLAVVNGYVICGAPDLSPVREMRRLYVTGLKPMFGRLGPGHIVVISAAAGIGEELFFRGVLLPEIGLIGSSLIFGVLHTGGRGTYAFGAWVALMGAGLGWLSTWSGGLVAPIVAHAVYDALAMSYIRWGRDCRAVRRAGESLTGHDPLPPATRS